MLQDCALTYSSCSTCNSYSASNPKYFKLQSLLAELPFDHIVFDLFGPLQPNEGYYYIFVIIDVCTRFVILRPLRDKAAKSVAESLIETFANFGLPKIIQSDNGSEFNNVIITYLANFFCVDKRVSLPYHPRCNGIVEREMRTLLSTINKQIYCNLHIWKRALPATQIFTNSKIIRHSPLAPFTLMFSRIVDDF